VKLFGFDGPAIQAIHYEDITPKRQLNFRSDSPHFAKYDRRDAQWPKTS
jgi:hypothetical protein